MRFSTDFTVRSESTWLETESLRSIARAAEAAGFDGLGFSDHPAPSGKWLDGGGHENFDPFSAMSFVAAVTTRLRPMANLLVVPYRNPFLQASAMSTVDNLAGGRTIFVLGSGYLRSEFSALGVDFERRNETFDEAVACMRAFFTGEDLSREGADFVARGARMRPLPVQRPHPPLWVGGNSSMALDRVASWGQGWSVMSGGVTMARTTRTRPIADLADLGDVIADLERRLDARGRALDEISIQASSAAVTLASDASVEHQLDEIGRLRDLGVGWVQVGMDTAEVGRTLDAIAQFGELIGRAVKG